MNATDTPQVRSKPTDPPITPPQPSIKKIPFFKTPLFLGLLIGILFTSGLAYAYYYSNQPRLLPTQPNTLSPTSAPSLIPPSNTPVANSQSTGFGQITWLSNPKEYEFSSIFNSPEPELDTIGYFQYFQLGYFSNQAKLYVVEQNGPGGLYPSFFIITGTPDNKNYYLNQDGVDTYAVESFQKVISLEPISLDQSVSVTPPSRITQNGVVYKFSYATGNIITNYDQPQKLFSDPAGDFYQVTTSSEPWFFHKSYFLKQLNGLLASYDFDKPFITDERRTLITWTDGRPSVDNYDLNFGAGCGGPSGTPFIKDDSPILADKVQVGQTPNNGAVYQIKNKDNILIKYLYDAYMVGRDQPYPSTPAVLSFDQFVEAPNHFLWQDPAGDWQVFVNYQFAAMAECGKPVIYLYPEHDQQVTVRVGANITVSEPLYPTEGWTVLAHPDGQLDYQGRTYPNLFWEGTGWGPYPNYQNRGVVVAQKDLVSTLYRQLSQLGLNQQESADFMDFWQSRLPASAYVRLTWLLTDDMDQLAPLSVSPRPNTSIRIFLEFQGLNQPIPLIPQKLSAPTRTGFTLIEWGGLLIKN